MFRLGDSPKEILHSVLIAVGISAAFCLFLAWMWHGSQRTSSPEEYIQAFRRQQKQYEEVVKIARSDRLKAADHNHHIKILPSAFDHLSDGGEIIVEKPTQHIKVFFLGLTQNRDLVDWRYETGEIYEAGLLSVSAQ